MAQAFKPRADQHRRDDEQNNAANTNQPSIASTARPVTTPRDPNPTDAYVTTFSPTKATGTGSRDAGPTEDEIRRHAYEIYQGRGGAPGRESEDWAQAERELREKRKATR